MTGENHLLTLEPVTQAFVDRLTESDAFPLSGRSAGAVRAALSDLQSGPIGKPRASIEHMIFPVGPKGAVDIRIVRPKDMQKTLPLVMFFHGGGWVAGGFNTHERLVREIAVSVHAAVLFVAFSRAPEDPFPVALEEAYAATVYAVEHARSLNLDAGRLAVMGDGAGGNIAAALAMLCKQRREPKIVFQVLCYPVTAANFPTKSYRDWRNGLWLTEQDMAWHWQAYSPSTRNQADALAAPLSATAEQLRGLPETLLITAEADVLRDQGEAYARKLSQAYVRTTCTRYIGTIHDFLMLDALADTPAARGAVSQVASALKSAFV